MSSFFAILASFVGVWAAFKYIILIETRIDANTFKNLYSVIKDENKIILSEEIVPDTRYPINYSAFCFIENSPWFYISHSERLMQAGWHGKDHVTILICFRWKYNKLRHYLKNNIIQTKKSGTPVQLLMPDFVDKIGSLKEIFPEPVIDESLWRDFENEVKEVVENKRKKTSALLYGLPGNGKTSLIKYISTKYNLPINIFTLNPDWSNHELLLLFSQIPKKCIVLLEDFDNYFDGRKCIFGGNGDLLKVKFTFDVILNGLDGVYNTYDRVIFIMTVNDIEKVDPALKNRPSRFKFVKHFDNPSEKIRRKLLSEDLVKQTEGLNLDQIFRLKENRELAMHKL